MYAARIFTAIALGGLFIGLIMFPPPWVFALCVSVVTLFAAWEWGRLSLASPVLVRVWLLGLSILLALLYWLAAPWLQRAVILLAMGWWCCLVLSSVCVVRRARPPRRPRLWLLLGYLALVPAWLALLVLSRQGQQALLLLVLVSVWAMDIGAWWVGGRWGRRRLASRISPGKTWEGLLGGLCTSLPATLAYLAWHPMPWREALPFVLLAVLSLCCSVVGDLLESLLKRGAGRKDSGAVLPGHGGLLDRVDSLSAAAPVWVGGLVLGGYV